MAQQQLPCPRCSCDVPSDVEFCVCGWRVDRSKLRPPLPQPPIGSVERVYRVVAVCAIAVLGLIVAYEGRKGWSTDAGGTRPLFLTSGSACTLARNCLAARSLDVFDDIAKLKKAGDDIGLLHYRVTDAAVILDEDTDLHVIERHFWSGALEVRVESGTYAGARVFLSSDELFK